MSATASEQSEVTMYARNPYPSAAGASHGAGGHLGASREPSDGAGMTNSLRNVAGRTSSMRNDSGDHLGGAGMAERLTGPADRNVDAVWLAETAAPAPNSNRNTHGLFYIRRYPLSSTTEAFTPRESPKSNGKGLIEEENVDGWTMVTRRKHSNRGERVNQHFQPPPKRMAPQSQHHTILRQERLLTRDSSTPVHRPPPARKAASPPPSVPRFIPGSTSLSWKDICTSIRSTGEDCNLEYIEPLKR